jgi:hypothetical protein
MKSLFLAVLFAITLTAQADKPACLLINGVLCCPTPKNPYCGLDVAPTSKQIAEMNGVKLLNDDPKCTGWCCRICPPNAK